jgi:tetraacyldisaccharide 4'-kinase
MIFLRKILFPFAILYGFITSIRNCLYDNGIFKSYSFDIPIIAVGNLSVGGTGKTPQIEYLIRLLQDNHQLATLSRGYKRKSEGFLLASDKETALTLGDEPYQMYQKFPKIQVAVDANRKNGIETLLAQKNKPDIILLDDAFQHRKVKAGFYILLTAYDDLYVNDFILPTGNLRESRKGAKRAQIVVVTKCPNAISEKEKVQIQSKLGLQSNQKLYFSTIAYDDFVYNTINTIPLSEIKLKDKLLLAGIAKPDLFFDYLKQPNDEVLTFPDHHHFTENDLKNIGNKAKNQLIITTEKDYVRLSNNTLQSNIYYLPIKSKFLFDKDDFNKTITNYVGKSTRNS